MVFLFSDLERWTQAMNRGAQAMTAEGTAVLGITLPSYLEALRGGDDRDCHYLDSDIERLSKQTEKQLGMGTYRWPIMAQALARRIIDGLSRRRARP